MYLSEFKSLNRPLGPFGGGQAPSMKLTRLHGAITSSQSSQSSIIQQQQKRTRIIGDQESSLQQVMSRVRADFMLRDKDKATLQLKVNEKSEQLDHVMTMTNTHVKALGTVFAKVAFQKRKLELAVNYLDSLKESNTNFFDNDLSNYDNTINELQNVLDIYNNDLSILKAIYTNKIQMEYRNIINSIEISKNTTSKYMESMDILQENLLKNKEEMNSKQQNLRQIQNNYDELNDELNKSNQSKVNDTEMINDLNETKKLFDDDVLNVVNNDNNTIDSLKNQIESHHSIINDYKQKNANIENECNVITHDIDTEENQKSQLKNSQIISNAKVVDSEKDLIKSRANHDIQKDNLQSFVDNIDNSTRRLRELDNEITTADELCSKGRTAVDIATSENQNRINSTQDAVKNFFKHQAHEQELRWMLREAEQSNLKQIETKQKLSTTLHHELQDTEQRAFDTKQSYTEIKAEVIEANALLNELQSNLSNTNSSINKINNRLQKLNKQDSNVITKGYTNIKSKLEEFQSINNEITTAIIQHAHYEVIKSSLISDHGAYLAEASKVVAGRGKLQKKKATQKIDHSSQITIDKLKNELRDIKSTTYPALVAQREAELDKIKAEIRLLEGHLIKGRPEITARRVRSTSSSLSQGTSFLSESRVATTTTSSFSKPIETMDWFADDGVSFGIF